MSLGADTLPYAYSGQIAADGDVFGTGCAVKEKVVLTAAHVVWDERTKTNRTGLRWLHLRHKGQRESPALVPRGAYIMSGYADQRLGEPNPNQVSLATRDLDVAALYFLDPAARGGYAGYLVSGPTACGTTNWLELQRNALLVGYPLGRIKEDFGKMHKHGPDLYAFARETPSKRVYSTTQMRSHGGASGGPLCIQAPNHVYYPAAVYLGTTGNRAMFCAIDSEVADVINKADRTADTGQPHVTDPPLIIDPGLSDWRPGSLTVELRPPGAVAAGAGWQIAELDPTNAYRTNIEVLSFLPPLNYILQFKPISGFAPPSNYVVRVFPGQDTWLVVSYETRLMEQNYTNGAFQFVISGTAGTTYILEASTNLGVPNPLRFAPLETNVLPAGGQRRFVDTNAFKYTNRFYRVRLVP